MVFIFTNFAMTNQTPPNPDVLVETALATLPLAPLPDSFITRTMGRLTPRPVIVARFRLDFLDMALPVGLSVFAAALVLLIFWLTGFLSFSWLPVFAEPIEIPPLTQFPFTTLTGIGLLLLAIEAVMAVLGVLAYNLWVDNNPPFASPPPISGR